MRLIHCTQILLKELKVTDPVPAPDIFPAKGLGNWYANLLRINRRKCILFTNEKTMYTFLIPNMKKDNIMELPLEFTTYLIENLQYEGFSHDVINVVRDEYSEITYAKTKSRSILGSMNELVVHLKYYIQPDSKLENVSILELNQKINKTPMKSINYQYPIESLEKAMGNPPRKRAIPNTLDEWLMEIAKAYCDALDSKPFGIFVDVDIKDEDLYHIAPHVCLKHRGLEDTVENIQKATEAALASYVASKEIITALKEPHIAFAFCFLASHFGLGLLSQHAIDIIMRYVEQEADRLLHIIEYRMR